MNRLLAFLISLIPSVIGTQPDPRAATTASATPRAMRVVGYLASWGVRSKGTAIADLPAGDLTHIFYAFAEIAPDGSVTMANPCLDVGTCGDVKTLPDRPGGNFGELQRLKRRYPHLKLTISIGGWGGSARFSDAALTDSSRRRFASSAIDLFIRKWPGLFDGIDIDWEFPVEGGLKGNVERPEDKRNFTLLLAELRRELDEQGARDHRHYELTIAASARPSEIANIELDQIVPLLDFINVMTYDYHTGGTIAHFNAPLFPAGNDPTPELTVDASMRAFQQGGAPRDKLLVGIPFFARVYGGVPNVNGGFLQRSSKRPDDWRDSDGDWRRLSRTRLIDPRYIRHWEVSAQVPWLYDAKSGTWISYDDPESVRAKMKYVRDNQLGGVVIWEIGADDGRLMREIARGSRPTSAATR
ncbi:MAG TPA: glycoside hydrolase family 18 protein [Gemmatimonadaceae bacterium]|nr:glycoside hydrolase family 18 protein [Gemmatimonadaceae bacterium]